MKKVKRLTIIWTLTLFAAILTGCSESEDTFISKGPVNVDLNFTLSGTASHKTRMSDAVVQTDAARDYESFIIVPMNGTTPDIQSFSNEYIKDKKTSEDNPPYAKFYHYGNCDMSVGDDCCIVYTKAQKQTAPTGVSSEAHNGSLSILYDGTPSESFPQITADEDYFSKLTFSPVSMRTSTTAPTEANVLATYLSNIANATTNTEKTWQASTDPVLKQFYKNFTNNGKDIPGSAACVKEWANQLKTALTDASLYADFTEGSDATAIRNRIVTLCNVTSIEIDNTTYQLSDITYPRNYDLPDGAAVLRWNSTNQVFEPRTETTTVDNISTITRFAYPPELYYFVESAIRCRANQVEYQSLYGSNDTWAEFVAQAFPEGDETTSLVTETTHSVALVTPVKYAVSHLQLNVLAGATVKDATNEVVTIGTENFPLTGVIVGGQRAVDYQFDPIIPASSSQDDIKFVYDSQVNSYNTSTAKYTHYLNTSSNETTNTLVLQSKGSESAAAEAVTIILEFENRSGHEFYGVHKDVIYPGTRFYLVGTIPAPTYDEEKGDYSRRVFTKAYTTVVNLTVNSLANAYNVLPNILSSSLEVGVELVPDWIAAQPATVILEK